MGWELGFAVRVVFNLYRWIARMIWHLILLVVNRSQEQPQQFDAFEDNSQKKH